MLSIPYIWRVVRQRKRTALEKRALPRDHRVSRTSPDQTCQTGRTYGRTEKEMQERHRNAKSDQNSRQIQRQNIRYITSITAQEESSGQP